MSPGTESPPAGDRRADEDVELGGDDISSNKSPIPASQPDPQADDLGNIPSFMDRRTPKRAIVVTTAAMLAKRSWRDQIKVHPAADFPPMSRKELINLGNDILAKGMRAPIALYTDLRVDEAQAISDWQLLDGQNRLDALETIGLTITIEISRPTRRGWHEPLITIHGETLKESAAADFESSVTLFEGRDGWSWIKVYDDPDGYVASVNIHRRHLTTEQKRDLIAKLLKANPEKSDRAISKQLKTETGIKADHKTVAAVRRENEPNGEFPHKERAEASGRKARGRRPMSLEEAKKAAKITADASPSPKQRKPEPVDDLHYQILKLLWNAYPHTLDDAWNRSEEKTRRRFIQWLEGGPAHE